MQKIKKVDKILSVLKDIEVNDGLNILMAAFYSVLFYYTKTSKDEHLKVAGECYDKYAEIYKDIRNENLID